MIIAVADSRKAKMWKNIELSWEQFLERAKTTKRTTESMGEYKKMSKLQQDDLKDCGGFVGGSLRDGMRRGSHIEFRSIVTLDLDYAPVEFWEYYASLFDYKACIYSTHKNTADMPRLRLILPLARNVSSDEYVAISRLVAKDIGIEYFDDCTYEPSRLMYWPSTSCDAEFVFESQEGELLDPDIILSRYNDWRDASQYPVSSRQSAIVNNSLTVQADPLTKEGIVGSFCRAYGIEVAIDKFLSDIYEPSATEGRYDYIQADSSAGVVIYNGKFAYSNHATDPACGKLCNAFDIVRLHIFGALDDEAADGTPVIKLPSFIAMQELAENDEQVRQMIDEERLAAMQKDFEGIEVNPRKMFFEKKKFIAMYLAKWFLMQYEAIILQEELYIYKNGRYINGERLFKEKATRVLKAEFQTNRLTESLNYIKNTVPVVSPDDATNTGEYLNVKNGLLNLNTFEFKEHTPNLHTIIQLPVEYNPNAKCVNIDKFLNIVAEDSVPVIEEMLGYCLISSMKYEKSFLFHGEGSNGKGTLIALIQTLLGSENVSNVALQALSENRFLAAELFGKMVNLHADIPNRVIEDTSLFKELTSGDRIQAEKKHKAPFSFCNRAKLIFSANELSSSKDNSYGFHRKWTVIPFNTNFDNRELRQKLFEEEEITGLLTKAIDGLKRLIKQDGFSDVESIKKQGDAYREKSDSVYQFLNECCLEDSKSSVGKQTLYDIYRRKCIDWGCHPVNQGNFNSKIKAYRPNIKEDRNQKIRKWRGIKTTEIIDEFL